MANIDKVSVKNTVYNIVSPAVVSDYIEVIGGACTKPDGYVEDEVILAKQNDVQLLFKATQVIAFGANIVENTNCVRTTLEEVLKNAGGGGASSADQVSYDNSNSGLEAENVQEAVDELASNAGTVGSQIQTLTNDLTIEVDTRKRFNVDNLIETTLSGSHDYQELTYVVNNDKSITFTVNSTVAADRNIPIVNNWDGFDISSHIGEKLVISGANSLFPMMIIILDSSNQTLTQIIYPEQGNTITVPSGAKYCRVVLNVKEGTTPQTYTYYPRLSVAMTNQELTEQIGAIGTKVQGTKSSVALPNNGAETTVATMTLDKGKWLIYASGYSPMDLVSYTSEATSIKIHGLDGYWGIPLSYMFNLFALVEVSNDNTIATLDVTNWESSAVSESTTNFAFDAYRLI